MPSPSYPLGFYHSKPLGLHLNGDESMVLGGAFLAANRSTNFRVRPLGLVERSPFPIDVHLEDLPTAVTDEAAAVADADTEDVWSKRSTVFKRMDKFGTSKKISITHDKDMLVTLAYEPQTDPITELSRLADGVDPLIAQFNITGIHEAATGELAQRLGAPKVTLSFKMDADGRLGMTKAEATFEELIIPTPVPAPEKLVVDADADKKEEGDETEADAKAGAGKDEAAAEEGKKVETDADADADAEAKGEADANVDADKEKDAEGDKAESKEGDDAKARKASEATPTPEPKPIKKVHRVRLTITPVLSNLSVRRYNKKELEAARDVYVYPAPPRCIHCPHQPHSIVHHAVTHRPPAFHAS